jgi:ATP-dependent Clp protease ATP-binding subunit ClpC
VKPGLFDYSSKRAELARKGHILGRDSVYALLVVSGWIVVSTGLYAVFVVGAPIGWFMAGLSGVLWVVALWGRSLRTVPTGSSSSQVDQVLETELLAKLPEAPTPKKVAEIVVTMQGGIFFANRFMLGSAFLINLVSDEAADMDAVWSNAIEKMHLNGCDTLSAAIVTVALIESIPNINQYIAQVGLDVSDLQRGLRWYLHISALINEFSGKKKTGGIGRDWAFGFTPMLERFGHNISEQVANGGTIDRKLKSRDKIINHITEILAQSGRRNAALVGQLGIGKTKLVQMLANSLIHPSPQVPRELRYAQIIALDPSALISQARGRGELEQLVQHLCVEALRSKNVVLFLDDAHLFFEDSSGSVNLSNVLMPFLDGGALRIILALDEQRWMQISQANPSLSQYLNRVVIQPTSDEETLDIMENQALLLEHQYNVLYTFQAFQAALQLSSRYIATQVMPGRALSLLEASAHFSEQKLITKKSVEQAVEQTQGIKVGNATSLEERDTLLHLEERIHERMINQTHAVSAVAGSLRRARAGVRNPKKPIGTFLFLGPTGVGKTELAKSVAAVFFGEESRLIRLDLNEFVRSEDVARLIADPSKDSNSLSAQVSKQPFSVILLDEIEKAHPEVLNTLLQVLDEGILRDITNREISFRDAVIIATSNAGADRIRAHIEAGDELEQFEDAFIDELIGSGVFKPEFLNRFDEIALFRPLMKEELLKVVDIILRSVNQTLSSQKLQIKVEDAAKTLLVDAGYDPRLGARPLRRVVQKTVENLVAEKVLNQQAIPGDIIIIDAPAVEAMLLRK